MIKEHKVIFAFTFIINIHQDIGEIFLWFKHKINMQLQIIRLKSDLNHNMGYLTFIEINENDPEYNLYKNERIAALFRQE